MTQHIEGCTFEADINKAFCAGTGSGECSGTARLERNPPAFGGFPALELSDGWNDSVRWEIKFCPLCGVQLTPTAE